MSLARAQWAAGAASAALLLCAFAAEPAQSALSPDGRWRAVVDNPSSDQADGADTTSVLRVAPAAGGPGRVLLRGKAPADEPKTSLHNFEEPHWSLDGGFVYVLAGAWVTSAAVHQVDVRTGAERFVVDANTLRVLRDGPYRGMLLVARHKYYGAPRFGSYNPTDVVRPDGKRVLTVPGSGADDSEASVPAWLKAHGWRAD